MKKTVILLLTTMFLCHSTFYGFPGEFKIEKVTSSSGTLWLRVYATGNTFLWNDVTKRIVFAHGYDHSFQDQYSFVFDAPKDANSAKNGTMPWGLMNFELRNAQDTISFSVDFRDENWSTAYTHADIHVYFDEQNHSAYFHPDNGARDQQISKGVCYDIWDLYGLSEHANNFSMLFLKNTINGGNAGGTLSVNDSSYNSNDTAYVSYGSNSTIATNNERFENFQSSGFTYKHSYWNTDVQNDYRLSRSVMVGESNSSQQAVFLKITSAVLKNYFPEGGTYYGQLEFRDPWYENENHQQPNTFRTYTLDANGLRPTGSYFKSSGGVFQNRTLIQGRYYSVRALQMVQGSQFEWTFQNWSCVRASVDSSTKNETPVVFTDTGAIVTANYVISKPLPPNDVNISGDLGEHIVVSWTPYQNSNFRYRIYRNVKNESPSLVADLDPGTSSWTDEEYIATWNSETESIYYRVCSYYTTLSLESDQPVTVGYGNYSTPEPRINTDPSKEEFGIAAQKPKTFKIGNYPNPFNPSTNFAFELPANSQVNLTVYDLTGKRIIALVDIDLNEGRYSFKWAGKDQYGSTLSSGVYIYRFVAQPFNGAKGFVKSGKLMLMK